MAASPRGTPREGSGSLSPLFLNVAITQRGMFSVLQRAFRLKNEPFVILREHSPEDMKE